MQQIQKCMQHICIFVLQPLLPLQITTVLALNELILFQLRKKSTQQRTEPNPCMRAQPHSIELTQSTRGTKKIPGKSRSGSLDHSSEKL